jgi:hypothetical protein
MRETEPKKTRRHPTRNSLESRLDQGLWMELLSGIDPETSSLPRTRSA